jgi:hypothetical protein
MLLIVWWSNADKAFLRGSAESGEVAAGWDRLNMPFGTAWHESSGLVDLFGAEPGWHL